jgi:GT2 family glycosyltransferase
MAPFNFSLFCNEAAALARGRILLFLNDDTVALSDGWLDCLADWALRPACGAVGAKLLYPSRRVQHGGIVLGLGGYAAHVEVGARSDAPGFLGRLRAPHEVSAVTGACLAVEKTKFDSVAGFDEKGFPIELGDVDLCLRLETRGWRSILAPEAVLIHHESATRGRAHNRDLRYAGEQMHFASKWKQRIRDDPYFHPALSLNSQRVRLDG